MNYEAVYRTAPATPGLLKTVLMIYKEVFNEATPGDVLLLL